MQYDQQQITVKDMFDSAGRWMIRALEAGDMDLAQTYDRFMDAARRKGLSIGMDRRDFR